MGSTESPTESHSNSSSTPARPSAYPSPTTPALDTAHPVPELIAEAMGHPASHRRADEDSYVTVPLEPYSPPRAPRPAKSFTKTPPLTSYNNYDSVRSSAQHTEGVVSLKDEELSHLFDFVKEIGFGNWGSVWKCKPRLDRHRHSHDRLGLASAASGGSGAPGLVAIKLVHRKEDEATPHHVIIQRVRALWGEMKIIHSLRHEPHPSIIRFEAFVITPSYALVVMPYLGERFDVPLAAERAKPYFRQLASAVAYLHERGITHNDIKPANIVMAYPDVPVLIDFGFAIKYNTTDKGRFLSVSSWGTPEYLDPQRAAGEPHDERKSDVWSLGVTMYEILIGRTPFERDHEEMFETPEELKIYHERARRGKWLGEWDVPRDLEHLLRWMIYPDPKHRATALQAYHHPSLEDAFQTDENTPSIVRYAVDDGQYADADLSFISEQSLRRERPEEEQHKAHRLKAVKSDIGVQRKKDRRPAAPQALGDSVRQTSSVNHLRPEKKKTFVDRLVDCDQENISFDSPKRASAAVSERDIFVTKRRPRVPTPSHAVNKHEVVETTQMRSTSNQLRVTESESPALRPSSAHAIIPQKSLRRTSTTVTRVASLRASILPKKKTSVRSPARQHAPASPVSKEAFEEEDGSSSPEPPRTRQEAMLRTMRSLEGDTRGLKRSSSPTRQSMKRPVSLDLGRELEKQEALRRSALLENVAEMDTEEVLLSPRKGRDLQPTTPRGAGQRSSSRQDEPSPLLDVSISTGSVFPPSIAEHSFSGKTSEASTDCFGRSERDEPALTSRYRCDDLPVRPYVLNEAAPSPTRRAKQSTAPTAVVNMHSSEALDDLDCLASWAKSVERYVEDTRRAIAENRDPPSMPLAPQSMRGLPGLSRPMTPMANIAPHSTTGASSYTTHTMRTKRTDSTLVESWKTPTLTKRQTVSQVFKRFVNHAEKEKEKEILSAENKPARLAPHKSEISLGTRFHTISSTKLRHQPTPSQEFDHERQDGPDRFSHYSTRRPATPTPNLTVPRMAKPSSVASLRERARSIIPNHTQRDKTPTTLPRHMRSGAHTSRPETPGGMSMLSVSAKPERPERKSIFTLFGLRRKAAAAA